MIITICGSMRFWDKMKSEAGRLLSNHTVMLPMPHSDEVAEDLDSKSLKNFYNGLEMSHALNIKNSDAIYVINDIYDGKPYIGSDTYNEINIANRNGKLVFYLNEMENIKYLYTCDRMQLGIPKDYILKPFNYGNLNGVTYTLTYGIVEFKLNQKIIGKVTPEQYMEFIRHDDRIQELMKTSSLRVEYGDNLKGLSIIEKSQINLKNTIGTVVAFTSESIFVKMDDISFIKDEDAYVATPRVYGYFDRSDIFRIHSIVTWDITRKR